MNPPKLQYVLSALRSKGYAVFDEQRDGAPNLNIVGIRSAAREAGTYDDFLCWFWKEDREWEFEYGRATTDPGTYYLQTRLLNPAGAAILVPGQYRGVYRIDLHGGRYEALCQRNGQVRVYRDGDRDRYLDLDSATIQEGDFGINIHKDVSGPVQTKTHKSSAGCQVFAVVRDFERLMSLARQAAKVYGNSFTYTLIDEADLVSATAAVEDKKAIESKTEEAFMEWLEDKLDDWTAAVPEWLKTRLGLEDEDEEPEEPGPVLPDKAPALTALWQSMELNNRFGAYPASVARKILRGRERYEEIAEETGVPWYVIGLLHSRESGCDFTKHLHNGDSLSARTVRVPKGRPKKGSPPFTFYDSAVDALKHDGFTGKDDWRIGVTLDRLEKFNGLGYRNKGRNSPYLWSGANHYIKGKYTSDEVYNSQAVDKQVGCAVILKELEKMGVEISS